MTNFWTFVGVAASVATALPWDGASPTGPVEAVDSLGWTPIPTQPPLSPYGREMVPMPGKHIFARAYSDQLCGYINGVWAWTCVHQLATCVSSSSWLGCCTSYTSGSICRFETTCIGAAEQSLCGVSCVSNTLTLKCTRSTAPFCVIYTDAKAGLSGWGCETSAGLTEPIVVNSAITMVIGPSTQVVPTPSSTLSSLTHHSSPLAPSHSESSPPIVVDDTNVGAIVGGVVGGLAVVVLGGLGWFLVQSYRKKNTAATAAQDQTAYQPGHMILQPPMQPIHPGGYPDQNWANQVYGSATQPEVMPQQQSHQAKYADSEVTTPVNGPPQHGTQPQLQGYYARQP